MTLENLFKTEDGQLGILMMNNKCNKYKMEIHNSVHKILNLNNQIVKKIVLKNKVTINKMMMIHHNKMNKISARKV